MDGPYNRTSLHGTPGQVGFARDDKKERVFLRKGVLLKRFYGPFQGMFSTDLVDCNS